MPVDTTQPLEVIPNQEATEAEVAPVLDSAKESEGEPMAEQPAEAAPAPATDAEAQAEAAPPPETEVTEILTSDRGLLLSAPRCWPLTALTVTARTIACAIGTSFRIAASDSRAGVSFDW